MVLLKGGGFELNSNTLLLLGVVGPGRVGMSEPGPPTQGPAPRGLPASTHCWWPPREGEATQITRSLVGN